MEKKAAKEPNALHPETKTMQRDEALSMASEWHALSKAWGA
jgi:hypothetical protein